MGYSCLYVVFATYLQVTEMTTQDSIQCSCNHLSAFGGQLLVAPTPIDFDKVFIQLASVPDSGYIAVMIAISCAFELYLVLLMWARKNDKQDLMKVRTTTNHYQCTIDKYALML